MGRISRSGYCLTCRQRRVKCDRGQPACQRCLKSGHKCQGYEIDYIRMDKRCPIPQTQAIPRGPPLLMMTSWALPKSTKAQARKPAAGHPLTASARDMTIFMDHFMSNYQWAQWWKYLLYLGLRTDRSGATYKSTESLLSGYYAQRHGDEKLFVRSRQLYGESLALVSDALTVHTRESFAMLALPILVISMHPYVLDKSIKFDHHVGLGTVMMHCGPASFQRPGFAGLFRSCRAMLICQAFVRCERTFLEQPAWKTVPFVGIPKTHLDHLFDILAEIAGLFEDAHAIRSSRADETKDYASLSVRLHALRQKLDEWHTAWDAETPFPLKLERSSSPPTTSEISRNGERASSSDPNTDPRIGSLDRAIESLTHCAATIYLEKLIKMIPPSSDKSRISIHDPKDRPPETSFGTFARTADVISQCAYIIEELDRSHPQHIVAPIPVAILYCALQDLGGPGVELANSLAKTCRADRALLQLEAFRIWPTEENTF